MPQPCSRLLVAGVWTAAAQPPRGSVSSSVDLHRVGADGGSWPPPCFSHYVLIIYVLIKRSMNPAPPAHTSVSSNVISIVLAPMMEKEWRRRACAVGTPAGTPAQQQRRAAGGWHRDVSVPAGRHARTRALAPRAARRGGGGGRMQASGRPAAGRARTRQAGGAPAQEQVDRVVQLARVDVDVL